MYILKAGEGCVLKMRLVEANGAPIELRNARFVQAILHLPNEATMLCEDVRFDEVSQLVFVRLSAKSELTMEGVYGININALFDGRVVTSAVLDFAEVKANTESRYFELLIDLLVSTTDVPSCVKYTGASPKISENGTWLVFNDEINAFEDTGISIFGKSAYQAAIESGNFSGTEEEFNAYMGSIPQITNDAMLATESANKATENANNAGAEAVRIATESAQEATTAKENAEQATEQAKEATANANSAAQRATEEVQNLREKADTDGYYPDMTVGKSDNLVGRGDVQDAVINFRPSGGIPDVGNGMNITDGTARIKAIKGNSLVYNQQLDSIANNGWSVPYPTYASSNLSDGAIRVTVNDGVTIANVYQVGIKNNKKGIHLHRYLVRAKVRISAIYAQSSYNFLFEYSSNNVYMQPAITTPNEWVDISLFFDGKENSSANLYIKPPISFNKAVGGDWYEVKDAILIDLTQMFGTGNEPTTYEEYLQRKPINIDNEFAYNEGELVDMHANKIISTSDNAYDYTKGYARVMGGYKYDITANAGATLVVSFYADGEDSNEEREIAPDSEGKYIFPANGYCIVNGDFASGSDICVCLNHSYDKPHPAHQQVVKDLSFIGEAFPDGMRSAGSAFDEIRYNVTTKKWEAIKRIGEVDLGSLGWKYFTPTDARPLGFFYASITGRAYGSKNVMLSSYATTNVQWNVDKSVFGNANGIELYIVESSYTDATTFKQAMQGVTLYYELAEPIEVEIPNSENWNLDYFAWDFGTEEAIASVPSAPFRADINYEPNAVDGLRWAIKYIRALGQRVLALEQKQNAIESNLTD